MQVPLATGELLYTFVEFLTLHRLLQAADIIQPDICVCRWSSDMLKIAAIAEAHYVHRSRRTTRWASVATAVNVHFAAATHKLQDLGIHQPGRHPVEHLVDDPYLPKNGYLELRDRPGLGIEVDEEVISNNRFDRWGSAPRPCGRTVLRDTSNGNSR